MESDNLLGCALVQDHSSVPPLLTQEERTALSAAKQRYETHGDREYLAVLAEMRARSKERQCEEARDAS